MPKASQDQPAADDQRPDSETAYRLDRALRRSLKMPSLGAKKAKDSAQKAPRQTGAKRPDHET